MNGFGLWEEIRLQMRNTRMAKKKEIKRKKENNNKTFTKNGPILSCYRVTMLTLSSLWAVTVDNKESQFPHSHNIVALNIF